MATTLNLNPAEEQEGAPKAEPAPQSAQSQTVCIRITKQLYDIDAKTNRVPGDVIEKPAPAAMHWVQTGVAELVKTSNKKKETADATATQNPEKADLQ